MKVFNKHRPASIPEGAVYIGRPSAWGNPYTIGKDGSRGTVVAKFRVYAIERLKKEPLWLEPLRGKDLVCYCAPLRCHGDIILELLTRYPF